MISLSATGARTSYCRSQLMHVLGRSSLICKKQHHSFGCISMAMRPYIHASGKVCEVGDVLLDVVAAQKLWHRQHAHKLDALGAALSSCSCASCCLGICLCI